MKQVNYSVVVPVYGSTGSLTILAQKIKQVFENLLQDTYELIFVNDSSPDPGTGKTLSQLATADPCVKVISFTKNYGQQAATLCGMKFSTGNYIITMDDDLQHNPEDIPRLIAEKHHDVVIADFYDKKHSTRKKLFSKSKGYFDHLLLGKPKHVNLTSFRLISRVIADAIINIKTPYPFIPAQIFLTTSDIVNVSVEHQMRYEGETTYTFIKMFKLFSNLIINNSSLLLTVLGRIGIIAAILGPLYGVYLVLNTLLYGNPVVGWTTLVALSLLFGGLTLFGIGVIGEYLIRIIYTADARPTYVIRAKTGFDE